MADFTGLGSVADLFGKVIDKIFPDATQAAAAKLELAKAEQAGDFQIILEQIKTNQIEAASTNWFVAGWRPFIGWVCGMGLLYSFLVYPLLHVWMPTLQELDGSTLLTCLGGLLGLGALRTGEKMYNVAR